MRFVLRAVTFSYISLYVTQQVIGGLVFGSSSGAFFLLSLGLALLNIFISPIFHLVGLPVRGFGFLVLHFAITLVTMYILTSVLPAFSIVESTLSRLVIFGFVLPAKHLSVPWSLIFSALLFSVLIWFFNWVCLKKK